MARDSLPVCSNRQLTAALKRGGFLPAHTSGSHQTWVRKEGDGSKRVTVVPLGKKAIPKPTLGGLDLAGLSVSEFRKLLR